MADGTDPTYKEWKQFDMPIFYQPNKRTDPTYKEWKLRLIRHLLLGLGSHGSYLQGMETYTGRKGGSDGYYN